MRKILIMLLVLGNFAVAQYNAFQYEGSLRNNTSAWLPDSNAITFDVSGADSIVSIGFSVRNHSGLFYADVWVDSISNTPSVEFKVEIWNDATSEWSGEHFPLNLRKYVIDNSSNSAVYGDVITGGTPATTGFGVNLFWTTADLLSDSNYGWADKPVSKIRFWAVFANDGKGRIKFYFNAHKMRF